jgi:hypothetical protein
MNDGPPLDPGSGIFFCEQMLLAVIVSVTVGSDDVSPCSAYLGIRLLFGSATEALVPLRRGRVNARVLNTKHFL